MRSIGREKKQGRGTFDWLGVQVRSLAARLPHPPRTALRLATHTAGQRWWPNIDDERQLHAPTQSSSSLQHTSRIHIQKSMCKNMSTRMPFCLLYRHCIESSSGSGCSTSPAARRLPRRCPRIELYSAHGTPQLSQ